MARGKKHDFPSSLERSVANSVFSILASPKIQITHIHPANTHCIRSDLDQEDLIIDSYPLALANKIVPFSDQIPLQWYTTRPDFASSAQQCGQSSRKRARTISSSNASTPVLPASTAVQSAISILPTTKSARMPALQLEKILTTPERQVLPPPSTSTMPTARTITPGGSFLSPLEKQRLDTTPVPSRLMPVAARKVNHIPSALFSPPRFASLLPPLPSIPIRGSRGRGRGRGRRGSSRGRGCRLNTHTDTAVASISAPAVLPRYPSRPRPLVEFDLTPRCVDFSRQKSTLILRHDVSTDALRDVFMWSLRCVAEGKIVKLEEARMIPFHNVSRVHEIREVCVVLGLRNLRNECDETLRKWDCAEGTDIVTDTDMYLVDKSDIDNESVSSGAQTQAMTP